MMQKKVQIISDGSLDLSQELTKEKDIEVVPFYVSFDSETYQKEMVEVGVREFYQEMVDHPTVFPKTSMPSVHDYYEVFEKHAKEKMPVICICITKKFSGSLQSAPLSLAGWHCRRNTRMHRSRSLILQSILCCRDYMY